MKSIYLISSIVFLALFGCKDSPVEPEKSSNYSGQYQNVFYQDGTSEPSVKLIVAQNDAKVSGVGYFNGIPFSFNGTLINTHFTIAFDLLDTSMGDLHNCVIDGFFGSDYSLAGGYTLPYPFGTEKIRFKLVDKAN